ncbi:putative integral membrane protein [Brugia pahangi]
MESLESGQFDSKNEVNGVEMMSQNFANTKNVTEEKNEMENLNESLFAKIEKYLDLKKQYFCCCNINIWMLTIAAITIFTAVKTQILLLVTDDFTDNMPLLIWPFIVYLIIINLLIIVCLIYCTINIIPSKINVIAYFIVFSTIIGIQFIMLFELYIAFRCKYRHCID